MKMSEEVRLKDETRYKGFFQTLSINVVFQNLSYLIFQNILYSQEILIEIIFCLGFKPKTYISFNALTSKLSLNPAFSVYTH